MWRYLIAFGLLLLVFLLGRVFISWCTKSKIRDLSERAALRGEKVQELAKKLRRKNIRCLVLEEERDLDHALS